MLTVGEEETAAVRRWLSDRGMVFFTGKDEATELTDEQLRQQFAMYVAALRISDDFGVDCVGIQYQQGLKDLVAASDIAEGLLNNLTVRLCAAATGRGSCGRARRYLISTRWTRGSPSTPHHQPGVEGHGPGPLHHPARRPLG